MLFLWQSTPIVSGYLKKYDEWIYTYHEKKRQTNDDDEILLLWWALFQ